MIFHPYALMKLQKEYAIRRLFYQGNFLLKDVLLQTES